MNHENFIPYGNQRQNLIIQLVKPRLRKISSYRKIIDVPGIRRVAGPSVAAVARRVEPATRSTGLVTSIRAASASAIAGCIRT
ncbi:MAG: hypothetical protein LBI17_02705, partial [Rickettsiales bacterium]|nr:hypothetical protein [Rickettsiales bacterium]